ncbi:MAG: SGNH/GDSL hydrolase family protein [Rhodocyclaceae bacterium]|nr:SGNH/GDSL hydrolase family protein [Rhodocyclaceae bacterium]
MRHFATTLALAPVLLWQGKQTRAKVPRLPEPGGERSGIVGAGSVLRVLIVGDSAAAGVGAATQAEALSGGLISALQDSFQLHWRLVATTGHTTANAIADLHAFDAEPYDVIITSLGVNDVTEQHSLRRWRAAQSALLTMLQSRFEARHIFVCGLPPMHRFPALPQPLRWYIGARAKQFDRTLQTLTEATPHCEFVPLNFFSGIGTEAMASDGFHPGPAIYRQWADEIAGRIRSQSASWC